MAEDALRTSSRIVNGYPGCEIDLPGPFCMVIFGASGDLARRKILPALFSLRSNGLLPESFFLMGAARTEMTDAEYRVAMREAVKSAAADGFNSTQWDAFATRLHYCSVDYGDPGSYRALADRLRPMEKAHGMVERRLFYLAVPPTALEPIVTSLGSSGLSTEQRGFSHIVIEKPFGRDTASAGRLNNILKRSFNESQIYRMDHYLAKETVQNILMFRFANSIFEPLWNRRYIDHVQITASETLGVEHRAGYYEQSGVIRDMFQNHIFQLLALTAMEPPSVFEADRVRDEKVKVFRSIRPFPSDGLDGHVVIGQYSEGTVSGEPVAGYRSEPGVSPDSQTPTYAAMKVMVDNWRWNGVPFYLRSGKRLSRRKAEISVHFRQVPHLMFSREMGSAIEPNTLVLRVQPDEGINLIFQTKRPGSKVCLNQVLMDFSYPGSLSLDAYERALLDCMGGDQMLFVREDGVHQTWSILTPVIENLKAGASRLCPYGSGTDGPDEAARLIESGGRSWRPL
jgi:glucose-6-phosphate 1-dehydrogenase